MFATSAVRAGLLALLVSVALSHGIADAQLVDNPQNLLKAWTDAYATRSGEPMARVYARDAHLWSLNGKEPVIGIDAIKQFYDRTGQNVTERSASIQKWQILPRKRVTMVTGTMELKSRLKDGTLRNNPARFTMSIIRESRRQWAILSHHMSMVPN